MGQHNYTKCNIHLIWGTKKRRPLLSKKEIRIKVSNYLYHYSEQKQIYMYKNYVNTDHVHALIDLPVQYALKDICKLLKGSSSYWINKNKLLNKKFRWGRGYGAFSVSASGLNQVKKYIHNQEGHHRLKTFTEELNEFISLYDVDIQNR